MDVLISPSKICPAERIPLESNNTVKSVLRGHPWDKEKVVF